MSLRAFHIVFIVLAIVLCFSFGYWSGAEYAEAGPGWVLVCAIASILLGIGLTFYGFRVWRKLKTLGTLQSSITLNATILGIMLMTLLANHATACPSCYGDPQSSAANGINAAIFLLFGVTGGVVGAILLFFRRMKQRQAIISDQLQHQSMLN